MRVFEDQTGTEWMVWEVRPGEVVIGAAEQRAGHDRRLAPAPDPVIERRGLADRRVLTPRAVTGVVDDLARGWLTFQAGAVRRRLAPFPSGWHELPDTELAALCRRAAPARPTVDWRARERTVGA